MIKDVALGQYFPGNSIIHRLDPRTKLILTIAYIVILFICDGVVPYAIMTAFLLGVILLTRISLRLIFKSVRPILILLIFTAVLNLMLNNTELYFLFFNKRAVLFNRFPNFGFSIYRSKKNR